MNTYIFRKKQFNYAIIIFAVVFISACGSFQATEETETQVEKTISSSHKLTSPIPPSSTPSPTPTALPSPTPTTEPYVEDVIIPDCKQGGSTNEKIFSELMDSLYPHVVEMDSFRYRTIYRYKENDHYADDELSIELIGLHSGLLSESSEGVKYFYPMTSQRYERSYIIQTDLQTNLKTEIILYEQGLWVREGYDKGWSYYEPIKRGEILNFAEILSPDLLFFMLTGGGSLAPGIRTDAPQSVQTEIIDGEEVLHYCWVTPPSIEGIAGYLIHYESLYTFLEEVEVHLWTGAEDTKLVRLAVTGKHNSERLAEEEFLDHESDRDFLLWMEIQDVGETIEINKPLEAEFSLKIPDADISPVQIIETPHNELPLPEDVEIVDDHLFSEGYDVAIPREYLWPHYESTVNALDSFVGTNWYDTPTDRTLGYRTNLKRSQILAFYLEEMEKRGWKLDDIFFQFGWSRVFLDFVRDQVSLIIILEEVDGVTYISGVVPPDEEILSALIDGWETYTTENSGLLSDSVRTIAFDGEGNVWIGELEAGLSFFDGTNWMKYSNSELAGKEIWAIEFDRDGQPWIATRDALYNIKGEELTAYTFDDHQMELIKEIKLEDDGSIWISGGETIAANKISVFDGRQWKSFKHLNGITGYDFDADGVLIISTGDSVYLREGDTWIELFASEGDADYLNLTGIIGLQFDSSGQLWVASRFGDLMMFDGETWTSYNPEDSGLYFDMVEEMVLDKMDRVWLVTFSGGVYMFDTKEGWYDFSPEPIGISVEYPEVMKVDQDGRIWIGSRNGVAVFTPPEP